MANDLDLHVDRRELLVQLLPVRRIGGLREGLGRHRLSKVHGAADLEELIRTKTITMHEQFNRLLEIFTNEIHNPRRIILQNETLSTLY